MPGLRVLEGQWCVGDREHGLSPRTLCLLPFLIHLSGLARENGYNLYERAISLHVVIVA